MTDDLTRAVQLLRCCEVVLIGVDKVTSLHVVDGHGNRELSVRRQSITIRGVGELRRGHVVGRRNDTHGGRVT